MKSERKKAKQNLCRAQSMNRVMCKKSLWASIWNIFRSVSFRMYNNLNETGHHRATLLLTKEQHSWNKKLSVWKTQGKSLLIFFPLFPRIRMKPVNFFSAGASRKKILFFWMLKVRSRASKLGKQGRKIWIIYFVFPLQLTSTRSFWPFTVKISWLQATKYVKRRKHETHPQFQQP